MRPVARILLGVTGGIAAYKACELVRLLVKGGHEVIPLVTAGAERFVRAETFFALARTSPEAEPYPHLRRADLLVVAPLTAHTLARLAHGLADDVLTEAALAHDGPVLVAPAMNHRMSGHPATQANVALLRSRGVVFIGPEEGELAEGESGLGRMSEPEAIAARIEELLGGGDTDGLTGKHVLVSAGGTREPLDAVRFVGNRSSGRMGVALAAEARRRGATVTLLASNLAVAVPEGVEVVQTPTAADVEARGARPDGRRRDPDGGGGRRLSAGPRPGRQAAEGHRALAHRARADRGRRPGARGAQERQHSRRVRRGAGGGGSRTEA